MAVHDFRFIKDGYIVCNSKMHELICCKGPIEKSWKVKLQNYVRGLAITDFYIYAGTSTNHSRAYHDQIAGTVNNVIFKINSRNGQILDRYSLNENVGKEIYSIVAIEDH